MIVGSGFIWLHLPKTGGTSTAKYFRDLCGQSLLIDDDDTDSKHDSLRTRFQKQEAQSLDKRVFITSRRLPSWLLSDWHHKTLRMGIKIPFEPVRCGLFYSLRLGGIWIAADYWIQHFGITSSMTSIRLEHLDADANLHISKYLPNSPSLRFPVNNRSDYSPHLGDFFSARDIDRIYANNQLWSAWEEQVYGSRTELLLHERLRSLRRRLR